MIQAFRKIHLLSFSGSRNLSVSVTKFQNKRKHVTRFFPTHTLNRLKFIPSTIRIVHTFTCILVYKVHTYPFLLEYHLFVRLK